MSEVRLPWLLSALPMERTYYYGTAAFGPHQAALENCRRSRRGACEYLLRDPGGLGFRIFPTGEFAVLVFQSWPQPRPADNPAFHLLSDLQREFGDERFMTFWRSAVPVDSAFAAAFGTTMDDWMHAWIVRTHGAARYAPSVGAANVAASLAVSVVLVGLIAGLGARRRVEV
jgi:hypothetical protein